MTVNERIIKIIQSRDGMTQKKLGASIGVPSSTVNNWLNLGRSIPADYIKPIADCLGVSCEYLLTGEDGGTASDEDSEWLYLVHQLPDDAKQVMKDMMNGYIDRKS